MGAWNKKVDERLSLLATEVMGLGVQCNQMRAQGVALTSQVAQCSELCVDEMVKTPAAMSNIDQRIQTLAERQDFVEQNLSVVSENAQVIGETMKDLLDQSLVIKEALEYSGEEPQQEP